MNTVGTAIETLKQGGMIIVLDDEGRENEGDLIASAQLITPEQINFMAREGRGLICLTLSKQQVDRLELPMMDAKGKDKFGTAFTVSIEAAHGVSTGISAHDRALTAKVAANPKSMPADIVTPGHIFPLCAKEQGVLIRAGHTEAGVDLARLAGLWPASLICEIMDNDGSMMKGASLRRFAKQYRLPMIHIQQLIEYRKSQQKTKGIVQELEIEEEIHPKQNLSWHCVEQCNLPTEFGVFKLFYFKKEKDSVEYIVITKFFAEDAILGNQEVLVRLHSQCLSGDVFSSLRCDCGLQLKQSLKLVANSQNGMIIYLPQEGRGIGLLNKIKAYQLQERGLDTCEANRKLGFEDDLRVYDEAIEILQYFGVKNTKLLTNNPQKINALKKHFSVVSEPLLIKPNKHNQQYLKTKQKKMGHYFSKLYTDNYKPKIAIITSTFNSKVTTKLLDEAKQRLNTLGFAKEDFNCFWVPGVVEIPLIAKNILESHNYDAIICFGAVIKGETDHYNYVSNMVSQGIKELSLKHNTPLVFGILTTNNSEQAMARAGGTHSNKGKEAIDTAKHMIDLMREIGTSSLRSSQENL